MSKTRGFSLLAPFLDPRLHKNVFFWGLKETWVLLSRAWNSSKTVSKTDIFLLSIIRTTNWRRRQRWRNTRPPLYDYFSSSRRILRTPLHCNVIIIMIKTERYNVVFREFITDYIWSGDYCINVWINFADRYFNYRPSAFTFFITRK